MSDDIAKVSIEAQGAEGWNLVVKTDGSQVLPIIIDKQHPLVVICDSMTGTIKATMTMLISEMDMVALAEIKTKE